MYFPTVNEDNLDILFARFGERRNTDLHHRFSGWYRAIVEETNDPLNIRRCRVRIPELHNIDTEVEMLPWAIPAPWSGGINAGSFAHPAIKDVVYVCYEKNHPYVPIFCAAGDPTRRQMYPLWSNYIKSPLAVTEDGEPASEPDDHLKKFLPKDGRPMSMGFTDRYGHFLLFNAHGFFPKTHEAKPTPLGTDAVSKGDFSAQVAKPEVNEPDLKYIAMGTKYGHTAVFGDQGYQWKEEFEGDYDQDQGFEVDRYKYLLKYFNEQEEKDRDQRRIDIRTRLGHQFEMRDVGWDKSRSGEYQGQKTIGDSKDRDERWVKLRSKGGHLIECLDKGFEPVSDNFYKKLNNSEFGIEHDKEDQIGDDSRMIRLITRHGNMMVLDDRGTSPTAAEQETPHGNGVLVRTRKGFQMQMCDKPDLDHIMFATPKNQCFEINDETQYIVLSTSQSDELHTRVRDNEIKSRPPWINKKGLVNDPESNTCHLKLDKINDYCRLKVPDGAGFEVRGKKSPCGQWTETRDSENRAIWMSVIDQWLLIRNKSGELFIVFDDNDDALMIRNEKDKIIVHAKKDIHIKSDEGNICFEAPKGEIGFKAKKVAFGTEGTQHVIDKVGIGTDKKLSCLEMEGKHLAIQIPVHPAGPAPPAPRGSKPCKFEEKEISRKKPEDFDKERGCDPIKPQRGGVPDSVTSGGPGSGGSGGSGGGLPNSNPPPTSPTIPPPPTGSGPPTPAPTPDPIAEAVGGDGVLWYGLSNKFYDEVKKVGLNLNSIVNNLNTPGDQEAMEIHLSKTLEYARGKDQAILSQQRYGDVALILRVRALPEPVILKDVPGNDKVLSFSQDISFEEYIEIFEVREEEFTQPPLFPNA